MMTNVRAFLHKFRRSEDGVATIEFCIWAFTFFLVLGSAVDIGLMKLRHAMLERAVDVTVREIRLGTGRVPTFMEVRNDICERAGVLTHCEDRLMLEMVQVNPRNFDAVAVDNDCIENPGEPRPVRNFVAGQDNEMMLLRACYNYRPAFPTVGFGEYAPKNDSGYIPMIAKAAFVQEPR